MEIDKIETDKKKYLGLLLLADEQESMIDNYLEKGDMFVMYNSSKEPICSAVVTNEANNICELKNLAVTPQYQRKGYGRKMMDFLCRHYADRFKYMIVGTGDSVQTVSFYKNCGFHYSHTVPDFFVLNYDHPIMENGKRLKDMVYFKKLLTVSYLVCREKRNVTLVSALIYLWEESVKASHHFLTKKDIKKLIPVVRNAIEMIENLIILYHTDKPVGFIGIERCKIEMLFIAPEYFGCGFGKNLVDIAIKDYKCSMVDVNEQNPKARSFYKHLGFIEFERSEIDEMGNPFPIIKMKLPE